MMKILIDARFYGLEHTGIGRYVMNLVLELSKLDKDNEYLVLLRKKYFESLNLPPNFKKILADFGHYSFAEQIKIPLIVRKNKPDLVHFPHFNVPLAFRGAYVVTIHDLLMHTFSGKNATTLPAFLYFTKRIAYKTVFKKAVKGALKVIVPTKVVKTDIVSYYKIEDKKVSVIYEGITASANKSSVDASTILKKYGLSSRYFIYTGNAYPHKNLERAIRAIIRLNQHSQIQFAIVSSRNVFIERLGKLVAQYKAESVVRLLGYVPDDELSVLYNKSVGFLYPSLLEGFGLPGLEAISAGTITLLSDIPVFKEVYEDNALYFDPFDIESILSSLEKVVKMNKKERNVLIKKSQKFVQKYSWHKMAKETFGIYNQALRNGSSFSLRQGK